MAVAVASLLVVSASRLRAVLVSGRDRLRQAGHRAAAAIAVAVAVAAGAAAAVVGAATGAVAPQAADHKRPASFHVGRALHPPVLHRQEARTVGGVLVVDLREVAHVHLLPWAPPCRTAGAEDLVRDPAAAFVPTHVAGHLVLHLVVALACGRAPVAAPVVHPMAVFSLLRPGHPLREVRELARLVCRALCRVQTAKARGPAAVPTVVV